MTAVIQKLRSALAEIVGAKDKAELEAMEKVLEMVPLKRDDVEAGKKAIRALLETMEYGYE
jgi:hypothetical protein